MKIAIIGASGFIGSALTHALLERTNHQLVLFSHHAKRLHFAPAEERRLVHIDGSVLSAKDIEAALHGCDMAVYLVHLMSVPHNRGTFIDAEQQAADNFAKAAQQLKRVIYVGGMGGSDGTTQHLRSRQQTGEIIRDQVKQLVELRTPMVIGRGGAGYEILRAIVRRSPIFPLPRWARATTQPILVGDVVEYVLAAIRLRSKQHISIAIGGPELLSYTELAQRIARAQHKHLVILPLPFIPKKSAVAILRRIAPHQYVATVADMIASAGFSTPPDNGQAAKVFPQVKPRFLTDNVLAD